LRLNGYVMLNVKLRLVKRYKFMRAKRLKLKKEMGKKEVMSNEAERVF